MKKGIVVAGSVLVTAVIGIIVLKRKKAVVVVEEPKSKKVEAEVTVPTTITERSIAALKQAHGTAMQQFGANLVAVGLGIMAVTDAPAMDEFFDQLTKEMKRGNADVEAFEERCDQRVANFRKEKIRILGKMDIPDADFSETGQKKTKG